MLRFLITLFLPSCKLKLYLLHKVTNGAWVFGPGSKVGHSIIITNSLKMADDSCIGSFNIIKNMDVLQLGSNSLIHRNNKVIGTVYPRGRSNRLVLGDYSQILRGNLLDCSAEVVIGKNVVFGGVGCQVWTHSFDIKRNKLIGAINIESDVYIGSSAMIGPGVSICSGVSIGMGSIIIKNISSSGFYAGTPVKKISNKYLLQDSLYSVCGKINNSDVYEKK